MMNFFTPRTLLVVASLVLSVALGLTLGRGGGADAARDGSKAGVTIGLSLDTLKEARWQADRDMFVKSAGDLGATVQVLAANGDDTVQVSDVEKLITAGVDVLVLGIGYRGDVHEDFFSSAFGLRDALVARGARVFGHDPYFDDEHIRRRGFEPYDLAAPVPVRAAILQAAHGAYRDLDFRAIPGLEIVLDGRNALDRGRVEAAGLRYIGVGR